MIAPEKRAAWKNLLILCAIPFFGAVFLSSCNRSVGCYVKGSPEALAARRSVRPQERDKQSITINIKGMTCTASENVVQSTLKKVRGIMSVQADAEKGSAIVVYNPKIINKDKIVELVKKTGYEASLTGSKTMDDYRL